MSIDLSQFHQVFFEESIEGLDIMESALMELDVAEVDHEIINSIFRAAHSIKGGSATFGFKSVSDFTHDLETILDQVRDGRRNISKNDIDIFLQSVDCMREMISLLQAGEDGSTESTVELQKQFARMLENEQSEVPGQNAEEQTQQAEAQDCLATIKFVPNKEILQTGNDVVRMFLELQEFAEIVDIKCNTALPAFSEFNPEECFLSWELVVRSDRKENEILSCFEWVSDDALIEYVPQTSTTGASPSDAIAAQGLSSEGSTTESLSSNSVDVAQAKTLAEKEKQEKPKARAATGNKTTASESGSIRVGIDKIDNLINMVGELVITQSMLGQLGTDFEVNQLPKLVEGLGQLEQNTRELQESVMRIRMLPISFTFSRFPRMVRDLSQKLGKNAHLEMHGEQTELDKTVMEKIGDPLVHLVRNAVDHGIEMPADRLAQGKNETGTVTLNAYHQSGNVVIEIADDGKGLDRDMLVSKAVDKGVINQNEADLLSDEQVFDLIFHPGFSTAKEISDVSGRGVGMDVVKKNIQALNGAVELKSEKGAGSTITIRLPLTLAILDGQLVRVGGNIYIFPLVSIVESMQYKEGQVNEIAGGCNVFRLRDDYVPIVELHRAFGVHCDEQENALMVVVESDGEKVGIVVDELLAQQQVVIKSLEQNYRRVDGVSGATILGDGTVALILDIPGIVKLAGENFKAGQAFIASRKQNDLHQQQAVG